MASYNYPRWSQLTIKQQQNFGNGCGAKWFPPWLTKLLFSWFFEASCRKHDFGYAVGGSEFRRWQCDWNYAKAMWSDVKRIRAWHWKAAAFVAMIVFYLTVALCGWWRFKYGAPRSLEQVLADDGN